MPVITINGPIGAGNIEVGQLIAERLKLDYVDRMVFAEAAKLAGAPVGAMMAKEQKVVSFREKLGRFLQDVLERSAASGISGEAYLAAAWRCCLPRLTRSSLETQQIQVSA